MFMHGGNNPMKIYEYLKKRFNKNTDKVIVCFSSIFFVTIGYSSFIINVPSGDTFISEDFIIAEESTINNEIPYIELKYRDKLDKNIIYSETSDVNINRYNPLKIEKMNMVFSWSKKPGSSIVGNLTDYFTLYNSKDNYSDFSPYFYDGLSSQNVHFEENILNNSSLTSKLYFSNIYTGNIDLSPNVNWANLNVKHSEEDAAFAEKKNTDGKHNGENHKLRIINLKNDASYRLDASCIEYTKKKLLVKTQQYYRWRFYIYYFLEDGIENNETIENVKMIDYSFGLDQDRSNSSKDPVSYDVTLETGDKRVPNSISYDFTIKYDKGGFIPTDLNYRNTKELSSKKLSDTVSDVSRIDKNAPINFTEKIVSESNSDKTVRIYYQYLLQGANSYTSRTKDIKLKKTEKVEKISVRNDSPTDSAKEALIITILDEETGVTRNLTDVIGRASGHRVFANDLFADTNHSSIPFEYRIKLVPLKDYYFNYKNIIKEFDFDFKRKVASEEL